MASTLFTTAKVKAVSQDIPDTSAGGSASRKLLDSNSENYKQAMSEKSGMTITSDKDLILAKTKMSKEYAEQKIIAATTTISRNIDGIKETISGNKSSMDNNVITEEMQRVNNLKKSIVNTIQGVCGNLDGLINTLVGELNSILNQLTFDNFFNDILNDFNLSGLLEAFSQCVFWNNDHAKQLMNKADALTASGNIDTYVNILKTGVNIPDSIDNKCKQNVINNPIPGRTKEEHATDVSNMFVATGDVVTDYYKSPTEGITTEQLDISSDTFDLDKTDITTAVLFTDVNQVHTAHAVKNQYT